MGFAGRENMNGRQTEQGMVTERERQTTLATLISSRDFNLHSHVLIYEKSTNEIKIELSISIGIHLNLRLRLL
jgi:hypothetical protein